MTTSKKSLQVTVFSLLTGREYGRPFIAKPGEFITDKVKAALLEDNPDLPAAALVRTTRIPKLISTNRLYRGGVPTNHFIGFVKPKYLDFGLKIYRGYKLQPDESGYQPKLL